MSMPIFEVYGSYCFGSCGSDEATYIVAANTAEEAKALVEKTHSANGSYSNIEFHQLTTLPLCSYEGTRPVVLSNHVSGGD